MSAQAVNPDADRLFAVLAPELKMLCRDASAFCEITLSATLHDNDIGRIASGIVTTRKITPRDQRTGGQP